MVDRAVGLDMSVEQTINRSMKGSGGIIGSTRKKSSVAKWEIVYQEMLAVSKKNPKKNRTMTWISTIQKESQTMQMILDVTQSW